MFHFKMYSNEVRQVWVHEAQENFKAGETILYGTLPVNTWHEFIKTYRIAQRINLDVHKFQKSIIHGTLGRNANCEKA